MTKAGVMYVALTIFIGFAAVNTGNNLLFLIVSALLAFMAITGVFGWLNIRGITLVLELPDEIYDGAGFLYSVRVKNKKRFMPSFLLKTRVLGGSVAFSLVAPKAIESGAAVTTTKGRGYKVLGEVSIESSFPVNFFIRCTKLKLPEKFVVFPAPRQCAVPSGIGDRDRTGDAFSLCKGTDGDVQTIVDYTGREPIKHIHWRISAKHEGLKVKEMTSAVNEPVILDIDQLPGSDMNMSLGHAVFLVNRFISQKRAVGLKAGSLLIKPDLSRAHRLKLLTELATYGKS